MRALRVVAVVLGALMLLCIAVWAVMLRMPGNSHAGALPQLSDQQRKLSAQLRSHVEVLGRKIGERHDRRPKQLAAAIRFITGQFEAAGHKVAAQTFGRLPLTNLEVEITGTQHAKEIVVVGAQYDSAHDTPAANDNGSGVAALLTLAARLRGLRPKRTLRLVAFASEEPPHFQTDQMGSLVYAKRCKDRGENVVAMLSLETMGYFDDAAGSQKYPPPLSAFYPDTGNFIAVVGNVASRSLVHEVLASLRSNMRFPSEGAALPAALQGVGWSDHWSFWQHGYSAVMITDTAVFRYPHYHEPTDTPDKIDFDRLARVVVGLDKTIRQLID